MPREVFNWECAVWDELNPDQVWTKHSVIAPNGCADILMAIEEQFGYEIGEMDANIVESEKRGVNGVMFSNIICRGSRGHLFLINAVATCQA